MPLVMFLVSFNYLHRQIVYFVIAVTCHRLTCKVDPIYTSASLELQRDTDCLESAV